MRTPEAGDHVTENVVLVEKRGAGGMGHVWIAEHRALKTEVAVKLLWPCPELSSRELERFLREASAAARVKSPHVVTLLDSGVSELVGPYLVMELLEGEDLEERLRRDEKLPLEEASRLFSQIGHAIAQAHESGLVHRDLKPANIFLVRGPNGDSFAKVLDFGIARDLDNPLTVTESLVIGTPGYMSPEQAIGGEITPASDLYALGLVAFRVLTGTPAISRESREALGVGAYKLDLPRPSSRRDELPRAVDAWFARACAFAVEDRFGDATLQCSELAEALAHEPAQASARLAEVTQPEAPAEKPHVVDPPAETVDGGARPSRRTTWLALAALASLGTFGAWKSGLLRSAAPGASAPSASEMPAADASKLAIRFPMLVDMHGTNQKRGAAMLAAARAGALAVNRQGGVGGRDVEIAPLDDEGDGDGFLAQKVTEATKVANAKVSFGPTLSAQTYVTAARFADAGILQVSASASSAALANLAPTLLRLAPSDAGQAKALAALLKEQRCGKVVILADTGIYGRAFAGQLGALVPDSKSVFVSPDTQRSYAETARQIAELAPRCVALLVSPPIGSRYLRDAAASKLKPMYFAGDTLASQDFVELGRGDRADKDARTVAEGVRGVRPRAADATRPEYRYFEKLYREVAGVEPNEPFLAMQFDAVVLASLALDNVGVGSSALALKEAMLAATRGTSPFGPQQLDELRRAQKRGVAIDYEAASGDMVFEGEERVGKFANWAIEGGQVVDTK